MTHRLYGIWLLVVLVVSACGGTATVAEPTSDGITRYEPARAIEDIALVNFDNQEAHLGDYAGQYVMLAFGYTNCPDICPLTLAEFRSIKKILGDKADSVQFVFVSVDPTRDTPDRLKQYIGQFDADFMGLTAEQDAIDRFITLFGGSYTLNNVGGLQKNYTVDHTALKFLINPEGAWVRTYAYGLDFERIAQDMLGIIQ